MALSDYFSWSLVGLGLFSLVTYEFVWIIYCRTLHPFAQIPGPFVASFSRLWIVRTNNAGESVASQRRLHVKFGYLVRVAHNELSCSDPEAFKIIYGRKGDFIKSDWYSVYTVDKIGSGRDHFSNRDEKLHTERRRVVNNLYSLSNVLKSELSIDNVIQMFIQRAGSDLRLAGEFCDAGQSFDLGDWVTYFSFDAIGELYFGDMFGFMRDRVDYQSWIASIEALVPTMNGAAWSASYARPFIFASALLTAKTRYAIKCMPRLVDAAITCVRKRTDDIAAGKEIRKDILSQLWDIQEKGEKVGFVKTDIEQEAWVALLAGAETTGIALRAIFYYLMKNPAVMRRVVEEIDAAADKGELSNPVKFAEANRLPYFMACVKESLRIHPSIGQLFPRVVPAGGATISGQYIPAGYHVGMNPCILHSDKGVFGPDAEEYNPSRWIEGDATNMDRYFFTFGGGSRTCIGRNISIAEIYKLVPNVLRHYTVRLTDPGTPWKVMNFGMNKQRGIIVNFERRFNT